MQNFNYRFFSHHVGGNPYSDFIRKDVPIEHLSPFLTAASFCLSQYYPILISPQKKACYYNSHSSTAEGVLKADFLESWDKEIQSGFDNGFKYLIFIDGNLVGNDIFIYPANWCNQPITIYGKPSEYIYLTLSFYRKEGVVFYVYNLRSAKGAELLETYFGKFFRSGKGFESFGINLLTNMIRLTYASQFITVSSFKSRFDMHFTESMDKYKQNYFLNKGVKIHDKL